jgi:hypothetical protein
MPHPWKGNNLKFCGSIVRHCSLLNNRLIFIALLWQWLGQEGHMACNYQIKSCQSRAQEHTISIDSAASIRTDVSLYITKLKMGKPSPRDGEGKNKGSCLSRLIHPEKLCTISSLAFNLAA